MWRTEESELWFDIGTVVNLRVEAEKWVDQAPKAPVKTNSSSAAAAAAAVSNAAQERAVPFSIEVSHFSLSSVLVREVGRITDGGLFGLGVDG